MVDRHRFWASRGQSVALWVGCALSALAVVVPWWARVVVYPNGHVILKHGVAIVGDFAVVGWALGWVLLCVALILWWLSRHPRSSAAGIRPGPRLLLIVLAVLAMASAGIATAADTLGRAEYRVLEPEGPGDCRVVVREDSLLFSATGDAYVVRGWGLARRVGTWSMDDAYRPVESGDFDLDWGQRGGALVVAFAHDEPIASGARVTFGCG